MAAQASHCGTSAALAGGAGTSTPSQFNALPVPQASSSAGAGGQ
jgi:hypothetical protein